MYQNDQQPQVLRADAVATAVRRMSGDTLGGVHAQNLVIATTRELDLYEYPETKWLSAGLVPMDTGDSPGAVYHQYRAIEQIGEAGIVSDYATDIPTADIRGENVIAPYKNIAIGIQYSDQEIRTDSMDELTNIVRDKVAAARESHDRTWNNYIFDGVPGYNLMGVNTIPGKIVLAATTGTWTSATAAQMEADLETAITAVQTQSLGVETPDTVVMPLSRKRIVETTAHSTLGMETVLDFMKRTNPMIMNWEWSNKLDTASAAGGNALLVYRKERSRFRGKVSMVMAPVVPERRGFVTQLNFVTRWGGLQAPRPRSVLRLDGI